MPSRPHVMILGGGFAGLEAAKQLRRAPVDVTLIDRCNHHLFQPLLYQVAAAGLSATDIAAPIRQILRQQKNATVLLAEADSIDTNARRVRLHDHAAIDYDYLIVATGVTHSYFGHDEWARHAPGLKTLEEALEIRGRILSAFEHAEMEHDPAARRAWLTFAVIGGGPTGAELAGALAEIARHTLTRDFRRFDPGEARIVLVEGADQVLSGYPADLSAKAKSQLERLGVEVRISAPVTALDETGIWLGEDYLEARTILWAAGVRATPIIETLGTPLDTAGRVPVNPDLTLPQHPEVFVVGDLATIIQDGEPVPGVAPAAIQQGRHTARNIRRAIQGREPLPFRYVDRGSMATLGRKAAVAVIGRLHLSGFVAWLAWLFVHIFFLIGFRNRFVVLFEWAWSYFTYQRNARLILWGRQNRPPDG